MRESVDDRDMSRGETMTSVIENLPMLDPELTLEMMSSDLDRISMLVVCDAELLRECDKWVAVSIYGPQQDK